jgi:hypothetical protein
VRSEYQSRLKLNRSADGALPPEHIAAGWSSAVAETADDRYDSLQHVASAHDDPQFASINDRH